MPPGDAEPPGPVDQGEGDIPTPPAEEDNGNDDSKDDENDNGDNGGPIVRTEPNIPDDELKAELPQNEGGTVP